MFFFKSNVKYFQFQMFFSFKSKFFYLNSYKSFSRFRLKPLGGGGTNMKDLSKSKMSFKDEEILFEHLKNSCFKSQ